MAFGPHAFSSVHGSYSVPPGDVKSSIWLIANLDGTLVVVVGGGAAVVEMKDGVGVLFTMKKVVVDIGESGGLGLVKLGRRCWLLAAIFLGFFGVFPRLLLKACVFFDLSGPPTLLRTFSSRPFNSSKVNSVFITKSLSSSSCP